MDSAGDDGVPVMAGGAEVFVRRWDIVPIIVVELIKGAWFRWVDDDTGRGPAGLTGD